MVLLAAAIVVGAGYVAFLGLDTMEQGGESFGFGGSIPIEKAMSAETLLAYEMKKERSANRAMISQPRKIDPMGMMGKIFASVGATLVVIGVLIAFLLGRFASGGLGFYFAILAGAWGTGLLFLLLGLAQLLFFRNVGSANVVDQYFMALVNQDYTTAFQCLDPGRKTRQDEMDAQTWFTRRAQAEDEQGNITAYALKGFRLQGKSAVYTIKIIRGEGSYTVPVSLSKRGDTWKIIGFDLF